MNQEVKQKRTNLLGLGIIRLVETLPFGQTAETIGRQLLRAFHGKADEALYLMEIQVEGRLLEVDRLSPLMAVATALVKVPHTEAIEMQHELKGSQPS